MWRESSICAWTVLVVLVLELLSILITTHVTGVIRYSNHLRFRKALVISVLKCQTFYTTASKFHTPHICLRFFPHGCIPKLPKFNLTPFTAEPCPPALPPEAPTLTPQTQPYSLPYRPPGLCQLPLYMFPVPRRPPMQRNHY